jgi:putative acetyltransferase
MAYTVNVPPRVYLNRMLIRIEKAKEEDIAEVARLFKTTRESELPYLPKLHTPQEDVSFFRAKVFSQQTVHVLREDRVRLVGFIAFDSEWIHHLYILPELTGHGLGTQLMKLAKKNSKNLQLWAFERNVRAIRFYQKHGFKIIKKTDGNENEEKEPDVLMQWIA